MTLDKLLTLQLRPHVSAMLDEYVARMQAKLPEPLRAKVTRSLIIRKLLARPMHNAPQAIAYIGNRRFRDKAAIQVRVRCTTAEWEKASSDGTTIATSVAARIVDALHPDGNYPANPDTNEPSTKETP